MALQPKTADNELDEVVKHMQAARNSSPNEGNVEDTDGAEVQEDDAATAEVVVDDTLEGVVGELVDAPETDEDVVEETVDDEDASNHEDGEDAQLEDTTDDGDVEFVDIRDTDTVEVTIDGEETTLTIAELKQAAAGEGAIQKRLKDATDLRNELQSEKTRFTEDFSIAQQSLVNALKAAEALVTKPQIAPPPAELRSQDPQKYLLWQDAYDKDLRRIGEVKANLAKLIDDQQRGHAEQLNVYRREQANILGDALPILKDPEKGPKVFSRMKQAAITYGFSEAEIAAAADHRMFRIMHDAMLYQAMKGNKQVTEENPVKVDPAKEAQKIRRLRPGGGKTTRKRVSESAKKTAALKKQAAASGKVDDVAAFMAQKRQNG